MSSFAQLAALPGVGVSYLLEVSDDGFSTVDYRYSTVDGEFGSGVAYDCRIVNVGQLSRGFGSGRALASATLDVTLDNVDAGADFWIDGDLDATSAYEWRFKIALWDPLNPSDLATKTLGVFGFFNSPVRTNSEMRISLTDRLSAKASALRSSPTLRDWLGVTDAARPAYTEETLDGAFGIDEPLPLRFGYRRHPLKRFHGQRFILCATRNLTSTPRLSAINLKNGTDVTATLLQYEVETLVDTEAVPYYSGDVLVNPPAQINRVSLAATKSATISVDGVDWKIVWLDLDGDYPFSFRLAALIDARPELRAQYTDDIAKRLRGVPVSTQTQAERDARVADRNAAVDELGLTFECSFLSETQSNADFGSYWSAAATAYSLLTDYSEAGSASVNKSSFQRLSAARGESVNGSIEYSVSESISPEGSLVTELTGSEISAALDQLGQCGGFELVAETDGSIKAKALIADYVAAPTSTMELDETQVADVSDRIASRGERWEPIGSVYVTKFGKRFGPFRNEASTVSGSRSSITVPMEWVGDEDLAREEELGFARQDAWGVAQAILGGQWGAQKRTILSFTAWLEAIDLELGSLFTLSWTRGGRGTPYDNDLWRVESMTFDPSTCGVRIDAVFCADLPSQTNRVALVDNELLGVRAKYVDAETWAEVTDSDATVSFWYFDGTEAVNVPAPVPTGTTAGDILRLSNSDVPARHRELRITSVSGESVEVETGDLDFDAPTAAVCSYIVLRGKTTLPTSSEDSTNYPSGGLPYVGLADDADNKYSSNAENGHQLHG